MKRMSIKQKRAIYYATREKKFRKFYDFLAANNIDLKALGLDKVKYLEVCCRKLRALGYQINL